MTFDELVALVVALRARVEALEQRSARPGDEALLAAVLPIAAGLFGSSAFTLRNLFQAGGSAVRLALGGRSSTSLGHVFARNCDRAIAGLVLERAGTEGHAALWRIVSAR